MTTTLTPSERQRLEAAGLTPVRKTIGKRGEWTIEASGGASSFLELRENRGN